MKIIALNVARGLVPRPTVKTPAKGTVGDLCHEEQAPQTEIKRIMERYAGRLEEMLAWRSKPLDFADCSYAGDLQQAINDVRSIDSEVSRLASELNISRDDVKKLIDGDITVLTKNEVKHETQENQQADQQENLPLNGQSATSEE